MSDLASQRAGNAVLRHVIAELTIELHQADIGHNTPLSRGSGTRRSSVALWILPPGGNRPVIHRLVYPDGQPRDAEGCSARATALR